MSARKEGYLFVEVTPAQLLKSLERRRLYLANARKRRVDAVRKIRKLFSSGSDELKEAEKELTKDTERLRYCDALVDLVRLIDTRTEIEIDLLSGEAEVFGFGLDEKGRFPALS